MKLNDFDFTLPKELIAEHPKPRGEARMLDMTDAGCNDRKFTDLIDILQPCDTIVLNETKVIPTELRGFLINSLNIETSIRLNLIEDVDEYTWLAYAKPAKKLSVGTKISFHNTDLYAIVEEKSTDTGEIRLKFRNTTNLLANLEECGKMHLPPYIKRRSDDSDKNTYQTVFAKNAGSVAAPTAGLHFTEEFLAKLKAKGINIAKTTLHVGRGTFEPVKVEKISDHKMHSEFFSLDEKNAEIIANTKEKGGRVLCVGTTTMRTLESIAAQNDGKIIAANGETDIFIKPGFNFQVADFLLTNFHLPQSTLFILISAILGLENAKNMYEHAINERYRFFSYGDCSLLKIR